MAGPLANLVLETANAPGTAATFNLGGAPSGWRGFAATFGTGTTVFYFISDGVQAEWGTGTVTAGSLNTLSRGVAGNTQGTTQRLNFTGVVQVWNAVPAGWQAHFDVAGGTLPMDGRRLAGLGAATASDEGTRLDQVGWVHLGVNYVSDPVALVAFTLPARYVRYRLEFTSCFPAANGPLVMRFSTDGGASYLSGTTDYVVAAADIRATGVSPAGAATTYAELSPSTAANLHGMVEFETINNKAFRFDVASPNPATPFRRSGTGYASFGPGINAVMLGAAGTTVAGGRFRLLGGF